MPLTSSKNWKTVRLGEIAEIRRGASPRPIQDFLAKAGLPWVKISDATADETRFIQNTRQFIKEEGIKNTVVVNEGDFIVSNSATPGLPKFMKITAGIHDGWLLIKPNEKVIDKLFLYYRMIFDRPRLVGQASGAVFDNLKTDTLKDHEIQLPPLPEQREIAAILGSLDDKIELLRKENKTLESIAQTLFKEWFVDFRFPGATGKMVDSELGMIPEGWRVGKLGDVGDIVCGKTPSKSNPEFFGGQVPFIKIPDMHGQMFIVKTEDSLTLSGAGTQQNKYIPENSICVSCIATVGLVSITTQDSQTNQQINSIIPKDRNTLEYLYFVLKSMSGDLQMIGGGGSATLNVNTGVFSNIEINMPDSDILNLFSNTVSSQFEKIKLNFLEIQTLSKLRDKILNKIF